MNDEAAKQAYIQSLFVSEDEVLNGIPQNLDKQGLPQISVSKETGKFLYLLVKMTGARRVLEIGTLAGYSTIWLGRALPNDGQIVTIDYRQEHLNLAQMHLNQAKLKAEVQLRFGEASQVMQELVNEHEQFDLIFIDADKVNYPTYVHQAIALSRPGTVIVVDNLFFHGRVLDEQDQNEAPKKVRQATQLLAQDPRLESILIPIGDGVGVTRVREDKI